MSSEPLADKLLIDWHSKDAASICRQFNSFTLKSQVSCLEDISAYFTVENEGQESNIILGLLYCLLNTRQKNNLKVKIIKLLNSVSDNFPEKYANCVEEFLNTKINSEDPFERSELIALIGTNDQVFCMTPKFPDEHKRIQIVEHFIPKIFVLTNELFTSHLSRLLCESTSAERNENLVQFETLIKNTILVVQRYGHLMSQDLRSRFNRQCLELCNHDAVPVDLRSNCGILAVSCRRVEFPRAEHFVRAILDEEGLFNASTNYYCKLALHRGVLCVYPLSQICSTNGSRDVCFDIFEQILMYLQQSCHQIIILSSRILNHLVNKLLELTNTKDPVDWERYTFSGHFSSRLMHSLYMLWDHYLNIVRHQVRETFSSFLRLQLKIDESAGVQMQEMARKLFDEEPAKKYIISALFYIVPAISATKFLQESQSHSIGRLVGHLKDPALGTAAGNLIQALFEAHSKEADFDTWCNFWLPVLLDNYEKQMLVYGYEGLLLKLMSCKKGSVALAIRMLTSRTQLSISDQNLVVMCAKIKVVLKDASAIISCSDTAMWKNAIPIDILAGIMTTDDSCSRILAFNLICESSKSTELFSDKELELVLAFVDSNMFNPVANFRQKVVNNCKRLLERICLGLKCKQKNAKPQDSVSVINEIISKYENFIRKLFSLAAANISLDSSFPRRTTAFHILATLFDSVFLKNNCFHYLQPSVCTQSFSETLIVNLLDTFEVNKLIIMKLLQISLTYYSSNGSFFQYVLDDAWKLASSFKPPDTLVSCFLMASIVNRGDLVLTSSHGNGTNCRILSLCWLVLDKLESELKIARESILEAASNSPMYGLLVVLRVVMGNICAANLTGDMHGWSEFIAHLIAICAGVITVVEPVVNNNSPEGFLPMDFCRQNVSTLSKILRNALTLRDPEDADECFALISDDVLVKGQAITSQILLLCGWRSIKESCLLLGNVVRLLEIAPANAVLSVRQIETVGEMFLHLMTNTKHRGAFEQANVAFNDICRILWRSPRDAIAAMPEMWLDQTLTTLIDYKNPRLCATRRSAGLPFIVQSILATEPTTRADQSLKKTMRFLVDFATGSDAERKVHSMNIMRALFRETRLSDSMVHYSSDAVNVALQSYKSSSWAERNAATLMLGALINKIVGVKKNRGEAHCKSSISSVVFFANYPVLCDLFLSELLECQRELDAGKITVSTYPVLLVLSRLGQARFEGKNLNVLHKFAFLVIKCSFSPIYHLRLLASRALMPFFTPANSSQIMEMLFQSASPCSHNRLHGVLLCLKEIVSLANAELSKVYDAQFCHLLWVIESDNKCLVTKSTAIDLMNLLVKKSVLTNDVFINSVAFCCRNVLQNVHIEQERHEPELFNLLESCAAFLWRVDFSEMLCFAVNSASEEIAETCFVAFVCPAKPGLVFAKVYPFLRTCASLTFRANIYSILEKVVSFTDVYATFKNIEDAKKLYHILLKDLQYEYHETLLSSVITLLGYLLKYIIENESDKPEIFEQFLNDLCVFSDPSYSAVVRLSLANSLQNVSLAWKSNADKDSNIHFVKLLVDLLLADEADVQSSAAAASICFLNEPSSCRLTGENTHPKENIIKSLMQYLGNLSTPSSFAMISHIAMQEDEVEEFGLSQDKDRAFEKGETNLYREQTQLSKICANALYSALIKDKAHRIHSSCLGDFISIEATESPKDINISQYAAHLRLDIELVLRKMDRLRISTPLTFPNFSLWCTRLASRAVLYSALRRAGVPVESVSEACLDILCCSILRPFVFHDILKKLTE